MAAYVEHIVAQIEQNVQFLVDHGHMSQQDAHAVLERMPSTASAPTPTSVTHAVANLSLSNSTTATGRRGIPPPPTSARSSSGAPQAKAIWAYNVTGEDQDDLSFRPGDIIEIVEETNPDWWTGRINGKQGLFPSNHVEKLSSASHNPPASAPPAPRRTVLAPPPSYDSAPVQPASGEKRPYKPFGAAYHGMDQPPPPAVQVNSVGLQQADQTKAKSKYGKLGNTMANSAAGGVGFGAGAAIGGGLVRAIF